MERVVIIGAGPAGLASAGALALAGIESVLLERAEHPGASWRTHYDRLHLHTARAFSHLPGLKIPASEGRYVSRDGVIRYLDSYVRHHRLDVRTGTSVESIDRAAGGWRVVTAAEELRAEQVVVATGYNHTPVLPDWPGRETFTGELLHASRYTNGARYRGRDVLVVGTGNTGAEIAVDLAERGARRVRIAYRTPPHILRRDVGPLPSQLFGILLRNFPVALADLLFESTRRLSVPRLARYGLPDPGPGAFRRASRGEIPILDVGFIAAVRSGQVEPVPAVTGLDGASVLLRDGRAIEPDVVIVATGYRRGLEPLVGHLGLLGEDGRPRVHGAATDPANPGLRFIGYTNPVSGMFREIAIDARRIAAAIASELRAGGHGLQEADRKHMLTVSES